MKRRALLTLSVATTLGWSNAQAQEAANQSVLEEIVVTARQRAEKIEDVPATIQAFTARDIEIAGIERPTDFIALTPGLAQVQTAEVKHNRTDLAENIPGLPEKPKRKQSSGYCHWNRQDNDERIDKTFELRSQN
jgi:outer membrane receptor for ferrienterochelin and colicin